MTMGNHTYGQREIYDFIDEAKRLVRPANFPDEAPGIGMRFIKINDIKLAVINLQGRALCQILMILLKGRSISQGSTRTNSVYIC